jgi:hypothetical protein
MMTTQPKRNCIECGDDVADRRGFLKQVGGGAAALAGLGALTPFVHAAKGGKNITTDTAVKAFYASLADGQKEVMAFNFNHQLRKRVSANWKITKATIGSDTFTDAQGFLIQDVLKSILSEEGFDRMQRQTKADGGGLGNYAVAMFGTPDSEDGFQFELTGRHLTLRADGNRKDNIAFGGPIVYGHSAEVPSRNLYFPETKATNKLFQALDEKQKKTALVKKAPRESAVKLQGKSGTFPGIGVDTLSSDQQELVSETIEKLLSPYREADVKEVMSTLKEGGGLKSLNMAYYLDGDVGDDKVWDVWRIEGPSFVWHFRGDPHVHAYINIGGAAAKTRQA